MNLLIVVDVQNDFISGSLGSIEAVRILPDIASKIEDHLRYNTDSDRQNCVVFTQDTHFENYPHTHEGRRLKVIHCLKYSQGWKIPENIDVPSCRHITKSSFGLDNWKYTPVQYLPSGVRFLEDYDKIEVIGLCTDICVISNALILRSLYPEKDIVVDAKCCAGSTPEKHKAALEVMKSCHITVINE